MFSQGAQETLSKRELNTANFYTRLNASGLEHKEGRKCFQLRKGSGKTKSEVRWDPGPSVNRMPAGQCHDAAVTWNII